MIWTAFEIAINLFQAALMVYFVRRKFHLVHPELRYAFLTAGVIAVFLSIYIFFEIPITDTVVFILPACYAFAVSDEKWYVKVFWSVVLPVVFIGMVQLTMSFFSVFAETSWQQIMEKTPLRISFVISSNIAILIAVFLLTRRANQYTLSFGTILIFVGSELAFLALAELLYTIRLHTQGSDLLFIAAGICTMLCAILTLLLYEVMTATAEKKQAFESEVRTLQLTKQHAEEVRDMYSYMIAQQHDLSKQYNIVHEMLASGHFDESQQFLSQLPLPKLPEDTFITGCLAVDALLTIKKLDMDRIGAVFSFHPYPLHALPTSESNFCAILANLLDNAIEAVAQLDDTQVKRKINLSLARSWSMFFITCENSADPAKIKIAGNQFISSKEQPSHHGYGTRNIRSIVNQLDGSYRCKWTGQYFRVEIILPYPEESLQEQNRPVP